MNVKKLCKKTKIFCIKQRINKFLNLILNVIGDTYLNQKYISSVVESCTRDRSYVVMLKWDYIDEVYDKVKEKSLLIQKIGNMIEKFKFGETNISFYRTGKIMLTNVDHIDTCLNKLLR